MAGDNEIHNDLSGQVGGNSLQVGIHNGPLWAFGTSQQSSLNKEQEDLLRSLAGQVRSASDRELRRWGIRDRDALPVRWHTAAANLFDHAAKIHGSADPVPLDGRFTEILDTYETVRSKRLVILGEAGAGKTVLAHRLILSLLKKRETGHPGAVPVLFSLGGWNPVESDLPRWLAQQLVQDFPYLATRDATTKARQADLLIEGGFVLPVLDGFDEIPDRYHSSAIKKIGTLDRPLIVTSRHDEYATAARGIKPVSGAAAITLEPLTLDEARDYLCHTTSKDRAPQWEEVFEHIRSAPDEHVSRNLMSVLSIPLMVVLARIVYNDKADLTPLDLLDSQRFPSNAVVEDHLLGNYLTAVYAHSDTSAGRPSRPNWNPDRAHHWLGYLATHLQQRDTHDLTWWHLPATLHRRTRILATTAAFALIVGPVTDLAGALTVGLILGLTFGIHNEKRPWCEPVRLRLGLRQKGSKRRFWFPSSQPEDFVSDLVSGIVLGVAFGFAVGIYYFVVQGFASGLVEPLTRGLVLGLVVGLAVGLVYGRVRGLVYGIAYGILSEIMTAIVRGSDGQEANLWIWSGVLIGPLAGLAVGLANIALSALGEDHDPNEVIKPWGLLTTDRTVALVRTLVVAPIFGVLFGFVLGSVPGLDSGIGNIFGVLGGLLGGITGLARSAWGRWLLFTRLWLPLTRRLPWRPKRFLEDANDRGVLRTTGAVYQFRHARLRDHLAERYQT